jgi:hypothetical protein
MDDRCEVNTTMPNDSTNLNNPQTLFDLIRDVLITLKTLLKQMQVLVDAERDVLVTFETLFKQMQVLTDAKIEKNRQVNEVFTQNSDTVIISLLAILALLAFYWLYNVAMPALTASKTKTNINPRLDTGKSKTPVKSPSPRKTPTAPNPIPRETGQKSAAPHLLTSTELIWQTVGASIMGKSHKLNQLPCQDSHAFSEQNGILVAAVSDGAGTAEHSQYGSKIAAEKAVEYIHLAIRDNRWSEDSFAPSQDDWQKISELIVSRIAHEMNDFATEKSYDRRSMACTLISVAILPSCLLVIHIGDGRGAYKNAAGEWLAMFDPQKGEEYNQTTFVTSVNWKNPSETIKTDVISGAVAAFAIMSDGCESFSFEVLQRDEATQKYYDPNRPFIGFFDPILDTLRGIYATESHQVAQQKWAEFLTGGNPQIRSEEDDKTMVFGFSATGNILDNSLIKPKE